MTIGQLSEVRFDLHNVRHLKVQMPAEPHMAFLQDLAATCDERPGLFRLGNYSDGHLLRCMMCPGHYV